MDIYSAVFIIALIVGYWTFRRILYSQAYRELTDEESQEFVIWQACDAYAKDDISLEVLEEQLENILEGRTPVRSDGYPVYYDPRILDHVNY